MSTVKPPSVLGQQSRQFKGIKPTIENYTYLKSRLLDYTYLRSEARCLKAPEGCYIDLFICSTYQEIVSCTKLQAQALTVGGRNKLAVKTSWRIGR